MNDDDPQQRAPSRSAVSQGKPVICEVKLAVDEVIYRWQAIAPIRAGHRTGLNRFRDKINGAITKREHQSARMKAQCICPLGIRIVVTARPRTGVRIVGRKTSRNTDTSSSL